MEELREKIGEMLKAYRDERVSYTDAISGILAIPKIALGLVVLDTPGLGKRR